MKSLITTRQITSKITTLMAGVTALALLISATLPFSGETASAQSNPEITLTPGDYNGRPTLKATANALVANWEFLRSSSDFDCSADIFAQHEPKRDLDYIFIPTDSGDLTYCFRVQIITGTWLYAKYRADFNPPAVVDQKIDPQPGQTTITITVSEPATVRYYVSGSQACDETLTTWDQAATGKSVTVKKPGYVCFQLTDQVDKIAYHRYQVVSIQPLVAMKVSVAYYADRSTIEAVANKQVSLWVHVISKHDLGDCADVDYTSPTGQQQQIVAYVPASHDQHYYFQASDIVGQTACGKVTITAAIDDSDPVNPPGNGKNAPGIDIQASGRQITASHSQPVAKWRYYRSPTNPVCNANVVWEPEQNADIVRGRQVVGLDDADVGSWVCFQAQLLGTAYRGQIVYRAVQIADTWSDPTNTQTLSLTFTQTPTTLTVTTDPAVPADRFQYLAYSNQRYPQGPNCRYSNPHMTAQYWQLYNAKVGNVVKLVPAAEGYYYCFRVVDDQGGASYGMYQVSGIQTSTQPTVPAPKTETPAVRVLEVRFSQTATTLTATTNIEAPGAVWQYLRFSNQRYPQGPNCHASNSHLVGDDYWNRYQSGDSNVVNLKADDEGKYYCFRVVDQDGNVALGQHRVVGVATDPQEPTEVPTTEAPDSTDQTSETVEDPNQQPPAEVPTTVNQPADGSSDSTSQTLPESQNTDSSPTPVVNVVNTPPQVTVNTPTGANQPIPIEVTVNLPETPSSTDSTPAADKDKTADDKVADEDDSTVQDMLWGLAGAIVTLIILTIIMLVVRKKQHRY